MSGQTRVPMDRRLRPSPEIWTSSCPICISNTNPNVKRCLLFDFFYPIHGHASHPDLKSVVETKFEEFKDEDNQVIYDVDEERELQELIQLETMEAAQKAVEERERMLKSLKIGGNDIANNR